MKQARYDWPFEPMDTIPVDHEFNTLLRLNPEFPLAVSHDNLSSYKNGLVNWHKQGSIEIAVVTEGAVTVNLLNHQERIKAGEGFLILPGILHSIRGGGTEETARYQTMFFEPCLLTGFDGSYYEKCFYRPEIIHRAGFFHFFLHEMPLRSCMDAFDVIFSDDYWGDPCRENQIQQTLQRLWIVLWENLITVENERYRKQDDSRLFQMIDFLQKNYQKKFVLDELCSHVNLCRSTCCRYFKQMMHMSISDYLNEYRLSQALILLNHTNESVTAIAVQTGFSTTSYFIGRFKEKMRVTPLEYRMKKRGIGKTG